MPADLTEFATCIAVPELTAPVSDSVTEPPAHQPLLPYHAEPDIPKEVACVSTHGPSIVDLDSSNLVDRTLPIDLLDPTPYQKPPVPPDPHRLPRNLSTLSSHCLSTLSTSQPRS